MTTWNKILHGIIVAGGIVAAIAAPPLALVPPVVGVIAGIAGAGAAYFASNPISLSNATQSALELATIAKQTQAAITKGKPANQ